jgi:hypothetical protein
VAESGNVAAACYLSNLLDDEDPAAAEFWDDRASQLLDDDADYYPPTVAQAWDDIEMHLLEHAPRLAAELAPPPTDTEIAAAQERLRPASGLVRQDRTALARRRHELR